MSKKKRSKRSSRKSSNNRDYKKWVLIPIIIVIMGVVYSMWNGSEKENSSRVVLETTFGDIEIELTGEKSSVTVENFLRYVNDGFYDGTVFHRVMPGFVIQGGGYADNGEQKETRAPIILESDNGLSNLKYTVAMARQADPNTATSQFYINLKDNIMLDYSINNPGYAVFGKVINGMDVVDKIALVDTSTRGFFENWPTEDVVILNAYLKD
jgi:cyclophilin family peptidyl-prolyl cis-trans isomerase